jgi:hypothetical protein
MTLNNARVRQAFSSAGNCDWFRPSLTVSVTDPQALRDRQRLPVAPASQNAARLEGVASLDLKLQAQLISSALLASRPADAPYLSLRRRHSRRGNHF